MQAEIASRTLAGGGCAARKKCSFFVRCAIMVGHLPARMPHTGHAYGALAVRDHDAEVTDAADIAEAVFSSRYCSGGDGSRAAQRCSSAAAFARLRGRGWWEAGS